jgi:hypothetical protein
MCSIVLLFCPCLEDFFLRPRIVLQVLFLSGMTNNEQDFDVCLRTENVILPKYGHFGVSAATGGLAGTLSLCSNMEKD